MPKRRLPCASELHKKLCIAPSMDENCLSIILEHLDLQSVLCVSMCSKSWNTMALAYLTQKRDFSEQILAICARWLDNGRIVFDGFRPAPQQCIYLGDKDMNKWREYERFLKSFLDSSGKCKREKIVASLGSISNALSGYIEAVFGCTDFDACAGTRPDRIEAFRARASEYTHKDAVARFLLPMSFDEICEFTWKKFYTHMCGPNHFPGQQPKLELCRSPTDNAFPRLADSIGDLTSFWLERSCAISISSTDHITLADTGSLFGQFQREFYKMLLMSKNCRVSAIHINANLDVLNFYEDVITQVCKTRNTSVEMLYFRVGAFLDCQALERMTRPHFSLQGFLVPDKEGETSPEPRSYSMHENYDKRAEFAIYAKTLCT